MMAQTNNHIDYVEFAAEDLAAAKTFYAAAFGWEAFYQKHQAAVGALDECDVSENAGAATPGHRYLGPAGG